MSAKAPTAYRTISEVADELNVQPHVLRFWESKFTQIKPMKRRGGRRYYSPKDVEILTKIQRLLYNEGYTIKGVQKVLKKRLDVAEAPEAANEAQQKPAPVKQDNAPQPKVPVGGMLGFEELVRHEIRLAITELEKLREQLSKPLLS